MSAMAKRMVGLFEPDSHFCVGIPGGMIRPVAQAWMRSARFG